MDITCRKFDPEKELEQQRELFIDCFPENIGTPVVGREHYGWKFRTFPDVPPSYEYAAWSDNEMVGYYAAIPYLYQIGEHTVSVGMVCDVMTKSSCRGAFFR